MTEAASTTTAFAPRSDSRTVETGHVFMPKFDADGLIPAIASDAETGEVLMFAFMNDAALRLSIETGQAHFYSRSRGRIWKKGEESGNVLAIQDMFTDCDQDVVWLRVKVAGCGVACHTGARSCFYRRVELGPIESGPVTLAARIGDVETASGGGGRTEADKMPRPTKT